MMLIIPLLNPPVKDLIELFQFMVGTGSATALLTVALFYSGLLNRLHSLRWTLLSIIALTVLLVTVNVGMVARLMYISNHDFVLTVALLLFSSVIAISSMFMISRNLIQRIGALGVAADKIALGELSARATVQGRDELAQLAACFNEMAQRLQQIDEQKRTLEQTRRDLFTWISHDLRTPLTAVRVMNEAIIDGVVTDSATLSRYHNKMQYEIQHLGKLIEDLFELSQLESGQMKLILQPTSLRDLISDTLESMTLQAHTQAVELAGAIDPKVDMINAAADKIQRVLHNLLDNAIRYTPRGGKIQLQAKPDPRGVVITVHNTGSFIAPEDLPHIFRSFYQGEPSRVQSNHNRGTGLGLAIARSFVEAHGGQIWVTSHPDQGTIFGFSLPTTTQP